MNSIPPSVMSKDQAHAALSAPGAPFEMEERMIRGISTRVFKNAPATLKAVFDEGLTYGSREFMVMGADRVTFSAFGNAVRTLAARLIADGIGKGDRVAVLMSNCLEWPVAFYAASLVGAIVAPLNAWWAGAELMFGLTDSGAKALICDAERWARIGDQSGQLPGLESIYVVRGGPDIAPAIALEAVIGAPAVWADLPQAAEIEVRIDPEDDAAIFYTSGTSGKPKGALLSHRAVCCNIFTGAFSQIRMLLMSGLPLPPADPREHPSRSVLVTIPMFHVTGLCAVLNVWLAREGRWF